MFVAGKTISATREAMWSVRVMAQCMAEGQAAGTAAVLCMKHEWTNAGIDIGALRKQLLEDDALLEYS